MIYGAPVWEGAITKHKYLQKLHSSQRLINIKIAKAYRTISFEASCVIAGVPPIGLVTDGKVQVYKRKHGLEYSDTVCDTPLSVQRHSMRHAVAITATHYATRRCQYSDLVCDTPLPVQRHSMRHVVASTRMATPSSAIYHH